MRASIEEELRHVIQERTRKPGFVLHRVTFGGRGVGPEIREGSWERIRDLIYEGRGT